MSFSKKLKASTVREVHFMKILLIYLLYFYLFELVVYMDPPWRIKGGQMYDSQFMFSNNKFSLEYDTMSNKEIGDIQVEKLSKKGKITIFQFDFAVFRISCLYFI